MRLSDWTDTHTYAVILGAYFVGIYMFTRLLVPWTDPAIYSADLWNITTSSRDDFVGF